MFSVCYKKFQVFVVGRYLSTTCIYKSNQVSGEVSCGESNGLILGVNSSQKDSAGSVIQLTPTGQRFDSICGGNLTRILRVAKPGPYQGEVKVFYGLHNKYSAVAVVGLGDACVGYNPIEQLDERKEAIRNGVALGVKALSDLDFGKIYVDSCEHAESAAEGASLGSWYYHGVKEQSKVRSAKSIELFDSCEFTGWNIGLHKAAAQNLARLLQETPGNNLTPSIFAQTAIELLSKYGISINVRMKSWAQLRNLNGFLAVAKGACEPPVFLEILYEGCEPDVCPVVVIGKGVMFHSGGLCLNSCDEMKHGRGDMLGAATVVAAIRAIAALKLPINVVGLLPLCVNLPGSRAYKPGDIIHCHNGKSVLVENTNCDGLLMHADTLSFAEVFKPKLIVDIGTLSPDMIGTMSTVATGVFSNSDNAYEAMRIASIHTGDRIWRLPLWDYFKTYMRTKISDYTNNTPRFIGGGACKTASFLQEFVPRGVDWIHIDGYNVMRSNGIDSRYLNRGMSGRPTRNLIEFLAQISCRELFEKSKN